MTLSKEELKTSINFTEADSMATVYTCSKAIMSKMDKQCKKNAQVIVEKEYDKTYETPISCVLLRNLPIQTDVLRARSAALAKELTAKKIEKRVNFIYDISLKANVFCGDFLGTLWSLF